MATKRAGSGEKPSVGKKPPAGEKPSVGKKASSGTRPPSGKQPSSVSSGTAADRQRRTAMVAVAVVALLVAVAVLYARGGTPPASAAGWIWNDPAAALAKARQENKPILVDFWASWCVWCKKMDDETYTDARVRDLVAQKYVALKIDVDKLPAFQKEFGAQSLPTTVVLDPSGKEVGRVVGFQTAQQFLPFLTAPRGGGR